MSDNEIAKQSQSLPSINIHAEHEGVAIGYTDSVNTTLNVVLVDGKKSPLSKDYYALLMGYDPFEKDYVLVSKDRALTEYIQNDVKTKFSDLTPEAITAIKEIPAVISCEADGTKSQQAVFAFISQTIVPIICCHPLLFLHLIFCPHRFSAVVIQSSRDSYVHLAT